GQEEAEYVADDVFERLRHRFPRRRGTAGDDLVDAVLVPAEDLQRLVGRPAVDDDVTEVVVVLRQDRLDRPPDRIRRVVGGRDDRDARELERPRPRVVL